MIGAGFVFFEIYFEIYFGNRAKSAATADADCCAQTEECEGAWCWDGVGDVVKGHGAADIEDGLVESACDCELVDDVGRVVAEGR